MEIIYPLKIFISHGEKRTKKVPILLLQDTELYFARGFAGLPQLKARFPKNVQKGVIVQSMCVGVWETVGGFHGKFFEGKTSENLLLSFPFLFCVGVVTNC